MEEDKENFYRKFRRNIKKVRYLTNKIKVPNTLDIMNFLTIDEKDDFSTMPFWRM